jgi:hypothetical protein
VTWTDGAQTGQDIASLVAQGLQISEIPVPSTVGDWHQSIPGVTIQSEQRPLPIASADLYPSDGGLRESQQPPRVCRSQIPSIPPKHPCCSVSRKIHLLQSPNIPLRLRFPKHPPQTPYISFVCSPSCASIGRASAASRARLAQPQLP